MAVPTPIAQSAIHNMHVERGAAMVESEGWLRPARYTSVEDEVARVRSSVGLHDVSPVGKLVLHGNDVASMLKTNRPDAGQLRIGEIVRHQLKIEEEEMDVVLACLAGDEVLVLTGPGHASAVAEALDGSPAECAHSVDITSALAGIKITGPLSPRLLAAVTEMDVSPPAFTDMSCAQGKVAEVHGTVLRRDLRGITSYNLYVGREFGQYVWDALLEAGEEHHITPYGTEAMEMLRKPK